MPRPRTALQLLLAFFLLSPLAAIAEPSAAELEEAASLRTPPRLAVAGIRRLPSPPPEALAVEVANAEESDDLNADAYDVLLFDESGTAVFSHYPGTE